MAIPRFTTFDARMLPLLREDVDTDQIIPASYLKTVARTGLGKGLFAHWREDPAFVLHRPEHQGAEILLAGRNFGCGSSREHAVWALVDHGFRAVISTAFADIFQSNAGKNGLLTIAVDPAVHASLQAAIDDDHTARVAVDLEATTLTLPDGETVHFPVDPFVRTCLLEGIDPLGYLLQRLPAIEAWEQGRPVGFDTRQPRGVASEETGA